MANKSYSEKLKDPRWQKRRLLVLESAGFKCESCGDTEDTLHVHHVYYEKDINPWDYDDEVYMVLCNRCHEKWHKLKSDLDKALCHSDVNHLMHLQEIVTTLSELGPNITLMFYDMILGYQMYQMSRTQSNLFGG